MRFFSKLFSLAAAALVAFLLAVAPLLPGNAVAQTANQPPGVNVVLVPLHISGQYTATTAAVARFVLPFGAQLIGVQATARASGGTSPTLAIDVQDDGVTVLSTGIVVTAGAVASGTIVNPAIADESVITVNLTIGGTSPTWNDIVVVLTLVRA